MNNILFVLLLFIFGGLIFLCMQYGTKTDAVFLLLTLIGMAIINYFPLIHGCCDCQSHKKDNYHVFLGYFLVSVLYLTWIFGIIWAFLVLRDTYIALK